MYSVEILLTALWHVGVGCLLLYVKTKLPARSSAPGMEISKLLTGRTIAKKTENILNNLAMSYYTTTILSLHCSAATADRSKTIARSVNICTIQPRVKTCILPFEPDYARSKSTLVDGMVSYPIPTFFLYVDTILVCYNILATRRSNKCSLSES